MESRRLAATIDHTLLRPESTWAQVAQVCAEAVRYGFAAVCVNPCWVSRCVQHLDGDDAPPVCTVIGFPLGASTTRSKAAETALAVEAGAREVDMVLNLGALRDGDLRYVEGDIRAVVEAAGAAALVKVILETCLLEEEEKVHGCLAARDAGAHFVKTSTGFSRGGATVEDVRLLRSTVGPGMGVKAAGGIRTRAVALDLLEAGASRLGCSASVAIVTED